MNPCGHAGRQAPWTEPEFMPGRGASGGLAGASNLKKNHPKTGAKSNP